MLEGAVGVDPDQCDASRVVDMAASSQCAVRDRVAQYMTCEKGSMTMKRYLEVMNGHVAAIKAMDSNVAADGTGGYDQIFRHALSLMYCVERNQLMGQQRSTDAVKYQKQPFGFEMIKLYPKASHQATVSSLPLLKGT